MNTNDAPLPPELCRMVAILAASLSTATNNVNPDLVLQRADVFQRWIMTGEIPPTVPSSLRTPPPPDHDKPFGR